MGQVIRDLVIRGDEPSFVNVLETTVVEDSFVLVRVGRHFNHSARRFLRLHHFAIFHHAGVVWLAEDLLDESSEPILCG